MATGTDEGQEQEKRSWLEGGGDKEQERKEHKEDRYHDELEPEEEEG